MQQWPSSQRVSQEIFPPSDNHISVKADDLFFTVHIKRGTLVVQQCFSLVLWNKLHMQGVCSDWNLIKIKAGGHESTSADRKPMNVKRTAAADALSGPAHWLSSCLVCSHCAPSFFSLSLSQQCWRHVPLWSPYLLGHQSFSTKQSEPGSTSAIHFQESFVAYCYKHTWRPLSQKNLTFAFRCCRDSLKHPVGWENMEECHQTSGIKLTKLNFLGVISGLKGRLDG